MLWGNRANLYTTVLFNSRYISTSFLLYDQLQHTIYYLTGDYLPPSLFFHNPPSIIWIPRNSIVSLHSHLLLCFLSHIEHTKRVMTVLSGSEQAGSQSIVPCPCVKTPRELIHIVPRGVHQYILPSAPPALFSSSNILFKVSRAFPTEKVLSQWYKKNKNKIHLQFIDTNEAHWAASHEFWEKARTHFRLPKAQTCLSPPHAYSFSSNEPPRG